MTIVNVTDLVVPNPSSLNGGHPLVNGVSFNVEQGEVFVIIGPNGAGKSSLLKAITNDIPYLGHINTPTISSDPKQKAKHVAVLHQHTHLHFPFTVFEVVELARTPHATGKKRDCELVHDALKLMDITHLSDRIYTDLSGGEKQRTQLARVFCQLCEVESSDRLLILDEPLTALDLGHQHHVMKAIRSVAAQGVTVIMVLHDINIAARYADKLLALLCSEQLAMGTPSQVINEQTMGRLFDLPVEIIMSKSTNTPVLIGI